MKRIFLLLVFILILTGLVACSSEESEELADYHNIYVEEVNPVAIQIEDQLEGLLMTEDDEEGLAYYEENITPLVSEVREFMDSREPESDVVKELHELRVQQFDSWFSAFDLLEEAMEKAVTLEDDDVILGLIEQSDEKFIEAEEKAIEVEERFEEMANEHNVELTEMEE